MLGSILVYLVSLWFRSSFNLFLTKMIILIRLYSQVILYKILIIAKAYNVNLIYLTELYLEEGILIELFILVVLDLCYVLWMYRLVLFIKVSLCICFLIGSIRTFHLFIGLIFTFDQLSVWILFKNLYIIMIKILIYKWYI